jgi:hypothetical protein
MPFGGYFDQYYNDIYKPAIEDNGLTSIRADSLFRPSTIISDIWEFTNSSKIMLADLTSTNANVMYELGLAHAIAKPTILISEKIDDVPFDLRSLRVLTFNKNETNWDTKLREKITKSISETLNSPTDAVLPTFLKIKPNVPEVNVLTSDVIEIKQMLNKVISSSLPSDDNTKTSSKPKVLGSSEFIDAVAEARKLYFQDGWEIADIKHHLINHYSISQIAADDIFKRIRTY